MVLPRRLSGRGLAALPWPLPVRAHAPLHAPREAADEDEVVPDEFRAALRQAAMHVFDDWFDRLWHDYRLEIEVHDGRRLRGRTLEDGLRLWAPFGLDREERPSDWWIPARSRRLPFGDWRIIRDVAEAEAEARRVLEAAVGK